MIPATVIQELGLAVPEAVPLASGGKEAIGLRLPALAGVASVPPPVSTVPAGQVAVGRTQGPPGAGRSWAPPRPCWCLPRG